MFPLRRPLFVTSTSREVSSPSVLKT